jgi:hypothetical protein
MGCIPGKALTLRDGETQWQSPVPELTSPVRIEANVQQLGSRLLTPFFASENVIEEMGPCAKMVSQWVNLVTRRLFATTAPFDVGSGSFGEGP